MIDDINAIQIKLNTGHIFSIIGPQGENDIFFGTVGAHPDFSNELVQRYQDRFGDTNLGDDLFGDHVTTLACGSSPWLLLQFPNSRRDEVVANVETLLMETV